MVDYWSYIILFTEKEKRMQKTPGNLLRELLT